MTNFNITKHFTFFEMTDSKDHPELVGLNRTTAMGDDFVLSELTATCKLLEKIREFFDQPVYILSGYRGVELNEAVGGSTYSQHIQGQAADFYLKDIDMLRVFRELVDELCYGDGIPMYHQMYLDREHGFIHLGIATGVNDGQHWVQ